MQQSLNTVKVNNEIELCEIFSEECKKEVERALLKNRISYFIRWPRTSIFGKKRKTCSICVNDNSKEEAQDVITAVCDETGYRVRFIMKKSNIDYL